MRNSVKAALMIPGMLAAIIISFVVFLLLIKAVWAWTVLDLFPGAVEQGLIARDITWFAAFKLAVFVAVIMGVSRSMVKERE